MTQAQPAYALTVGTVVGDTYRVTRLLGRGGMGSVWEADHVRLPGKKVAIKVLHTDVAGDSEALARFRREAEIATRLGHPNIVEVHDFNTLPDGQPYLVLEMLVGESLDARLRRAPVSADEAIHIAGQIAAALSAAHREGVIHRDLKPQNVFLVTRPDEVGGNLVKVLDFGISKIRGSQTVKTQDSTILGTPQYMAPEQAIGNHAAVDARTDVFALGAIVYEMLAGCPAFTGHSIPEVVFKVVYEEPPPLADRVPDLIPRVAEAVARAMTKQQDLRFADVTSFVEAMAGVSLSTLRRQAVLPSGGTTSGARAVDSAATMAADSQELTGRRAGSPGAAAAPAADDALAQTVDSGQGPVPSLTGPAAARNSAAAAAASTTAPPAPAVVSADMAARAAGDAPLSLSTEVTPRPAGSRRTWMLLAMAAILAAGAVAGALILSRGRQRSPAHATTVASNGADPSPASQAAPGVAPASRGADPAIAAAAAVAVAADAAPTEATDGTASDSRHGAAPTADKGAGKAAGTPAAVATTGSPTSARVRPPVAESLEPTQPAHTTDTAAHPPRDHSTDEGIDPASLAKAPADVRDDLIAAEKDLRAGNFEEAVFHATRAYQHGAGPRSMALKAMASCGRQDLSNAKAAARMVPRRRRALVRAIHAYCARHKTPLGR